MSGKRKQPTPESNPASSTKESLNIPTKTGKIEIGGLEYAYPKGWGEISLKEWIEFEKIQNHPTNMESVKWSQMMALFTGIKYEVIIDQPVDIWTELKNLFSWMTIDRTESQAVEYIKDFYWIDENGNESKFILDKGIEKDNTRAWIDSEKMIADAIKEKTPSKATPYWLAIYFRKKGEVYNDEFVNKMVHGRARVFQHLPMDLVNKIAGFFLFAEQTSKKDFLNSLKVVEKQMKTPEGRDYIKNLVGTQLLEKSQKED